MPEQEQHPFLIIDHQGSRLDFARKICIGIARSIFIAVTQFIVIVPYMLFLTLLKPLKTFLPSLYWAIEGPPYRGLLMVVASWQWSAGYTVAEVGDDLMSAVEDRSIVISNHQSTADVPSLFYGLLHKGNVIYYLMWIQDVLFKLTTFGWVSIVHGDFFIQQGKDTRNLQNVKLAKHIEENYIPSDKSWIMLFPEGGFLYKRKETSRRYARKYGYPHLEHVSLPRVGALQTMLQSLSPQASRSDEGAVNDEKRRPLKWLIDITVGYPENRALNLQTIMMGTRKPTVVTLHYRKFAIGEVPLETEALTKWLYKRFEEKEQLLDIFYKTGQFPTWDSDKCKIDPNQLLKPRHINLPDEKVIANYFVHVIAGYFLLSLVVGPTVGLIGSAFSLLGL